MHQSIVYNCVRVFIYDYIFLTFLRDHCLCRMRLAVFSR